MKITFNKKLFSWTLDKFQVIMNYVPPVPVRFKYCIAYSWLGFVIVLDI